MDYQNITFERVDRKAVVTLNRPRVLNAIDSRMDAELYEAFTEVRDNPEIWACIVTGAGERAFSAGHDMKDTAPPSYSDPNPKRAPVLGGIHRETKVWKPMIAAVHGYCLGAGLELALSCDIRIAAEDAQFGLPEGRWSLIAAAGGNTRLPRMVPRAVAMKMVLTGEFINARQALMWGLVTDVISRTDLLPTAHRIADTVIENAPLAVWTAKEIALRTMDMPLEDALAYEWAFSRNLQMTDDRKEGPRAFAEKRKPNYQGR